MVRARHESAESYGGLIWGSKALRGDMSPGVAPRGVKNHPLALKIHIFQDIKLKVGIQAAEWIESHMLEISYSYGAQGTPGALWRKGLKSHFDHP